jgi:vanillate O-demethylase ferredoxin subunit
MPRRVTIQSLQDETDRIRRYVLVPSKGEAELEGFEAGAHVAVKLGNGDIRQYSLSNPGSENPSHYEIAVLREDDGRGGSLWIHRNWVVGDTVEITDCANHFPLSAQGEHAILIAGGIGVTPMLSMAWALHEQGRSFEFYYCARSKADAAFHAQLAEVPFSKSVSFVMDGGDPSKGLDLVALLSEVRSGVHLYFCGPGGFMTAIRSAASHWPMGTVHYEFFGSDPEAELTRDDDESFDVEIVSSGQTFTIPADRSVLDVLGENGIAVEKLCEEGYCGSCLTGVISGLPDHRDTVQSEEDKLANDMMTLCCSRAKKGPRVLDL